VIAIAAAFLSSAATVRSQNLPASPDKPADFPAFAVKEGTTVQKRFEIQHELTVQKIELGSAASGAMSQQQLELSSEVVLQVADAYVKTSPVRPLVLQRLYKASTYHIDFAFSDASGQKVPDSWDAESPMKDRSVVFTWVPEEKEFGRHYDQEEGAEEHLSTLAEDLDLGCLLPPPETNGPGGTEKPRAVREGDRWTVDLKPLASLFSPGGSIPMSFVKGGKGGLKMAISAGVGGPLSPVFAGTIKGNASAKWAATERTDEGRLAVIEFAVDLENEADRTEIMRRYLRQDEDDQESLIRHAGVKWKLSGGSGTLRWNLDAGRFEKLDLVGREDVSSEIQFAKGGETSSQSLSMAGSLKIVAGVVPPKK
jgi:hypothetical protein